MQGLLPGYLGYVMPSKAQLGKREQNQKGQ